jgi:hypothetical protein
MVGVSAAATTSDASKRTSLFCGTVSYSDKFPNFQDIILKTRLLVKVNTVQVKGRSKVSKCNGSDAAPLKSDARLLFG